MQDIWFRIVMFDRWEAEALKFELQFLCASPTPLQEISDVEDIQTSSTVHGHTIDPIYYLRAIARHRDRLNQNGTHSNGELVHGESEFISCSDTENHCTIRKHVESKRTF